MLYKKLVFLLILLVLPAFSLGAINCPDNANTEQDFVKFVGDIYNYYSNNATNNTNLLLKIQDMVSFYLKVPVWDVANCADKGSSTNTEIFLLIKGINSEIKNQKDDSPPILNLNVEPSASLSATAIDSESGIDYMIIGEKIPGAEDFTKDYYDCNGENTCLKNKILERVASGAYSYQVSASSAGGVTTKDAEKIIAAANATPNIQNCSQKGGTICPLTKDCSVNWTSASDSLNCCLGTCINRSGEASCNVNSDCGVSGQVYKCSGINITSYNITFSCNNSTKRCSNSTTSSIVIDSCTGNKLCLNGNSTCKDVQCLNDSGCLGNTTYSSLFCRSGESFYNKIFTNKTEPKCVNNLCINQTTANMENKSCPIGEMCENGACKSCPNGVCTSCVRATCESLGKICNSWSDNCGGTLNCGGCGINEECIDGIRCVLANGTSCNLVNGTCGFVAIPGFNPNGCGINSISLGKMDCPFGILGTCCCTPINCILEGKNCGSNRCGGSCGECVGNSDSPKCVAGVCKSDISIECSPELFRYCNLETPEYFCEGDNIKTKNVTVTCQEGYNADEFGHDDNCTRVDSENVTFRITAVGNCTNELAEFLGLLNPQGSKDDLEGFSASSFNLFSASECISKTCSELGKSCGIWNNGCNGTINCGGCAEKQSCTNGACIGDGSCNSLNGNCKFSLFGCGSGFESAGQQDCGFLGTCCKEKTCIKKTCQAEDCGVISDGCGRTINCAGCSSGFVCTNGKCTKCLDSDNGTNFYIKANAIDVFGRQYTDKCVNGSRLQEFYCKADGNVNFALKDCECSDGACLPCTPKTCRDGIDCGVISDGCSGTISCGNCFGDYTCENGKCKAPCVPNCYGKCGGASDGCSGTCDNQCPICSDSDGGTNFDVKGILTDAQGFSFNDNCISSVKLKEFYCKADGNWDTILKDCNCLNGACLPCTPKTCAQLGKSCESWDDGCFGTINCGTCAQGTCSGGVCLIETIDESEDSSYYSGTCINPNYAYDEDWNTAATSTSIQNCSIFEEYSWKAGFLGQVSFDTLFYQTARSVGYANYYCYDYNSAKYSLFGTLSGSQGQGNGIITMNVPAGCIKQNMNLKFRIDFYRESGYGGGEDFPGSSASVYLAESRIRYYSTAGTTGGAISDIKGVSFLDWFKKITGYMVKSLSGRTIKQV
jgi:hypothetical protein